MPTRGALFLLAVLMAGVAGCATRDDRLWYKPGGNYTTAEFNRDRDACTKDRKVAPDCLKAKGWVPVTSDLSTPAPEKPSPRGRY